MPTFADGSATASGTAEWKQRVDQFFDPARAHKKPKAASWKRPLEPNAEHMGALDHAIRMGTGLGLAHFLAPQRLVLQPGDQRYFVDATKLPSKYGTDLGCKSRACIVSRAGVRQLEANWTDERRVLHEVLDQGSIGLPARHCLYSVAGVRGCVWSDPPHRRFNWWLQDVKNTGVSEMKMETTLLMSFRKGPWSGAANFWKVQRTAEDYFTHSTGECPIFAFLYDNICTDIFEGRQQFNQGSLEHIRTVWDSIKLCPYFHRKGSKIKRSRWFQWNHEVPELAQWWSVILLVLLVHSIRQGWYGSLRDTPLFRNALAQDVLSSEGEVERVPDDPGVPLPDNARPRRANDVEDAFNQKRKHTHHHPPLFQHLVQQDDQGHDDGGVLLQCAIQRSP